MKILVIGDIHLGKSRESTTKEKIIRQANSEAEETLASLILKFKQMNFDLTVHMGDSLRDTFDKKIDQQNTLKTLRLLQQIKSPQIHLLGNHELMAFSLEEINQTYQQANIEPKFHGHLALKNLELVWLDLKINENYKVCLSAERLAWLKKLKISDKPLIILSHYSMVPIDHQDTFYFANNPDGMHYHNFAEINQVLKNKKTILNINAHVHMLTHQVINNNHYISAPAFSENIAAQAYKENNPGVFSVLDVNEKNFCFSSYSRDFCFAKIQGNLS